MANTKAMYVRQASNLITRLDVRPVTGTHEVAVDYMFKTILRGARFLRRRCTGPAEGAGTNSEPVGERGHDRPGQVLYSGKNLISRRPALSSTQSRGLI